MAFQHSASGYSCIPYSRVKALRIAHTTAVATTMHPSPVEGISHPMQSSVAPLVKLANFAGFFNGRTWPGVKFVKRSVTPGGLLESMHFWVQVRFRWRGADGVAKPPQHLQGLPRAGNLSPDFWIFTVLIADINGQEGFSTCGTSEEQPLLGAAQSPVGWCRWSGQPTAASAGAAQWALASTPASLSQVPLP